MGVRHHPASAPVAVADIQAVARRVAEDVVPEIDVDGVATRILLPRLRPQLWVFLEVVEDLGAEVPAELLTLDAELVANDSATVLLPVREPELDPLTVEVEIVASLLELHNARLRRAHALGAVEREPARDGEIERMLDRADLVGATDDAEYSPETPFLTQLVELLRVEAVLLKKIRKTLQLVDRIE